MPIISPESRLTKLQTTVVVPISAAIPNIGVSFSDNILFEVIRMFFILR